MGVTTMEATEKEFFAKIKQATFANPFGPERESVDLELSGMSARAAGEEVIARLVEEVRERIAGYRNKVGDLPAEERRLLRYGALFYLFHLYCDDYDRHIDRQMERGQQPCRLEFATELLKDLAEYGVRGKEALQYLAFFFQLRRGFFFISKITGRSESVRRLRQALWNNIFTYDARLYEEHLWNRMEDFSTIILGETGTGKTLSAAAIGRSGHIPFDERKGCFAESFARTFISINLSQYSEHLIESELFGHKKGAFTGAVEGHEGVFARCSPYGAIFLDEIGEISVPLQIKLLKVLEERTFTPVGSHDEKRFQGRVIAATNQPLTQLRRQGGFRDDFYYRLCSDIIEVPSLHTRLQEDAKEMRVMLVATLQRILGHSPRSIINELSALIEKSVPKDYRWPGNIRELEQCVRGMLLNRSYSWGTISEEVESMDEFYHGLRQGEYTANELLAKYCALLYSREGTLEKVAARVGLDRRTVRKYVDKSERQGRAPAG